MPVMMVAEVAHMGWMHSGQKAYRGWSRPHSGASLQPQEHVIVAAIGRIIIWCVVSAIPMRTLEGLMAQMALASTQLGENTMELGSHVCVRLGISDVPNADMLSLARQPSQPALPQCIQFGVGWHSAEEWCHSHPYRASFSRTILSGSHLSSWTCQSSQWCA